MPATRYVRSDFLIRIDRVGNGILRLTFGQDSVEVVVEERPRPTILSPATWAPLSDFIRNAAREKAPGKLIHRITLEIEEPLLHALPWESWLRTIRTGVRTLPPVAMVRTSSVRPRALSTPLSLPIRILDLDPGGRIEPLFRGRGYGNSEDFRDAVRVLAATAPPEPSETWPKADIIQLPFEPKKLADALLRLSAPDERDTLGWLLRLTDRWRTRLLVLRTADTEGHASACVLAEALVARGGPAIAVLRSTASFGAFYDKIVHDRPLDAALANDALADEALFIGGGREESLRMSRIGEDLTSARRHAELFDMVLPEDVDREALAKQLDALRTAAIDFEFDLRERGGMLPLWKRTKEIRETLRTSRATPFHQAIPEADEPLPRSVRARLQHESATGAELEDLAPERAHLVRGVPYFLTVQIASGRDDGIRTVGARALVEDLFKWAPHPDHPERQGVWIEIGVSEIDFSVAGSTVQEVWLPTEGVTEPVVFTVSPRTQKDGVASLRYVIYHRNNVLQSFRFSALVEETPSLLESIVERVFPNLWRGRRLAALARALGVEKGKLGNDGWAVRLEFGEPTPFERVADQPARAVTIIANEVQERPSVVVKAANVTTRGAVETATDLPSFVERIRAALDWVSADDSDRLLGDRYRFKSVPPLNEGTISHFDDSLQRLAAVGSELYTKVVPSFSERAALSEELETRQPATISIVNVSPEKAIPWALVYDRFYDARRQTDAAGKPVKFETCHAGLGLLAKGDPIPPCAQIAGCVLASSNAPLPQTVACPLHFWGFRHIIEAPPLQVPPGENPRTLPRHVEARPSHVEAAAAFHEDLSFVRDHERALAGLVERLESFVLRDSFVDALNGRGAKNVSGAALIYFFGHACGGKADANRAEPRLELKGPRSPGIIEAHELSQGKQWPRNPLAFLNGCGTVGFRSDSLAPFVTALVSRGAAGVVGTEVRVWEPLAHEFAVEFLTRFLTGNTSAGAALLAARRKLLAKWNPLGLAYSLFASAELKLGAPGG